MTDIPAFPRPFSWDESPVKGRTHGDHPQPHPEQAGMSLRDYFAAAALTGFCGNTDLDTRAEMAAAFAKDAYVFADAMLAERLKKKK